MLLAETPFICYIILFLFFYYFDFIVIFGGHPESSDKTGTVAVPASVGAFTSVFHVLKVIDGKKFMYLLFTQAFELEFRLWN